MLRSRKRDRTVGVKVETNSKRLMKDEEEKIVDFENSRSRMTQTLAWSLAMVSMVCFAWTDVSVTTEELAEGETANSMVLIAGIVCFIWTGPLSLWLGIERYGPLRFQVYQPFNGGIYFILLQAVGWSMFAITCGVCLVVLLNFHSQTHHHAPGELSAIGAFGFSANSLLLLSVDRFRADSASRDKDVRFFRGKNFKTLLAVVAAFLAFVALIAVDLLSPKLVNRKKMQDLTTAVFFGSAFVLHVICGAVDLAEKKYRLFQPFRGGAEFQILQAIGWGFLGMTGYIYMHKIDKSIAGGLSLYGACGFVAVLVIATSLDHFVPYKGPSNRQQLRLLLGKSSFVYHSSWILQAIALGSMINGVGDRSIWVTTCFCLSPVLAHLGGWVILSKTTEIHLFHPLQGGLSFILSQTFGWLLYGILLFRIILNYIMDQSNTLVEPLSILSHGLLLASMLVYNEDETKASRTANGVRAKPFADNGSSQTQNQVALTMASDLIIGLGVIISCGVDLGSMTSVPTMSKFTQQRLLEITLPFWMTAKIVLYIATFGNEVWYWRPFSGPEMYIMSEAVSWTLFVIAILANLIVLNGYFELEEGNAFPPSFGWTSAISLGHLFSHLTLRYGSIFLVKQQEAQQRQRGWTRTASGSISVGATPDGKVGTLSKLCAIGFAHIGWFAFLYSDWKRKETHSLWFVSGCILSTFGAIIPQIVVGPKTLPRFKWFQPFYGGSDFVLLQAIGWTMFSICATLSLVVINVGLANIDLIGVIGLIGTGFYCAQMLILWSLRFFDPQPQHRIVLDNRVGLLLGGASLSLFLLVDFCVIRFGLPFSFVKPIIACAWVAACASVPTSAYILYNTQKRQGKLSISPKSDRGETWLLIFLQSFRSPVMIVIGCALWSFTILLGALLVVNSIWTSYYIPYAWTATIAGTTNIVSHIILNFATVSSARDLLVKLVPSAVLASMLIWVGIKVFTNIVLPLIRAFLDYPMHYYAVVQKRVEGWISPDGLQALNNITLRRKIKYFDHENAFTLDIMRPLHPNQVHSKGGKMAPAIYCHGGGHICVTSEILLHSMTPLCRAGMTVYSIDYPLSPEARYPAALLQALRAVLYVQKHHCANPDCRYKCSYEKYSEKLNCHECDASCKSCYEEVELNEAKCPDCGGPLGTSKVQLIGDSAGGNLVSMLTAILCNPDLRQRTIKMGGPDFADLLDIPMESYPQVARVVCLYGLLGRETPIDDPNNSWIWNIICHIGISFVFMLYDPHFQQATKKDQEMEYHSTITDLSEQDLKKYAPETLLICGKSDPLLPSNQTCHDYLQKLGHKVDFHVLPGTHAFHGFPANWMKYLGSDWETNALPATLLILDFLSGGQVDKNLLETRRKAQQIIPDYSPLMIFPFFFFVLPGILMLIISKF